MSKKFTEEQYQKVVEIADEYIENSSWGFVGGRHDKQFSEMIYEEDSLNIPLDFRVQSKEIMAIANPLTREWAHDKFVEKEKKYYWMSKTLDNSGAHYQLYRTRDNMIIAIVVLAKSKTYYEKDIDYAIAESEVKLWGYNPEMFDKEEV
mgnify:CR=1 FL=1